MLKAVIFWWQTFCLSEILTQTKIISITPNLDIGDNFLKVASKVCKFQLFPTTQWLLFLVKIALKTLKMPKLLKWLSLNEPGTDFRQKTIIDKVFEKNLCKISQYVKQHNTEKVNYLVFISFSLKSFSKYLESSVRFKYEQSRIF